MANFVLGNFGNRRSYGGKVVGFIKYSSWCYCDRYVSSGSVLAILSAVVSCQNLGANPLLVMKTIAIIEYSTLTVVFYWDT